MAAEARLSKRSCRNVEEYQQRRPSDGKAAPRGRGRARFSGAGLSTAAESKKCQRAASQLARRERRRPANRAWSGGRLLRIHTSWPLFLLVGVATVPRTGNGWFRGLFEGTTGLRSLSVFAEPSYVLDPLSLAFQSPCGWLNDCAALRSPLPSEPFLIKTHFPFTTTSIEPDVLAQ